MDVSYQVGTEEQRVVVRLEVRATGQDQERALRVIDAAVEALRRMNKEARATVVSS